MLAWVLRSVPSGRACTLIGEGLGGGKDVDDDLSRLGFQGIFLFSLDMPASHASHV